MLMIHLFIVDQSPRTSIHLLHELQPFLNLQKRRQRLKMQSLNQASSSWWKAVVVIWRNQVTL